MVSQVPQIARALKKHKGTVALLVGLIMVAFAVITNCIFMIGDVVEQAQISTGVDEKNIAIIQDIAIVGSKSGVPVAEKLAELKRLPYVRGAAFGTSPLMSFNTLNVSLKSNLENATTVRLFLGSQGYSNALGIKVVAGRNLDDLTVPDYGSNGEAPALITEALDYRLFGTISGVGQLLYAQGSSFRVVGIMKDLRGRLTSDAEGSFSLLTIRRFDRQDMGGLYVIRSVDGKAKQGLAEGSRRLHELNPYHAQPYASTFLDMKREAIARRVALAQVLALLVIVLTAITCFTIGAMTSLWVRQRRVQIGIRRALGATKSSILTYFLIENLLVVGAGTSLGFLLAFGLNATAMHYLEMTRLPFAYCVSSMALVLILSQFSAIGPACKASMQAPAEVIRNQ